MSTPLHRGIGWIAALLAVAVLSGGLSYRSQAPAVRTSTTASDAGRLTIRLVRAESGAPLSGVKLDLEAHSASQEEWFDRELQARLESERATCTTDARGEARFELRLAREYALSGRLREAPFSHFRRTLGPVAAGELEELLVEITTIADCVVRGRVESASDHRPIAGALVRVFDDQPVRMDYDSPTVRRLGEGVETAQDGGFTLRVSSAFPARLSIVAAGFSPAVALIHPPGDPLPARIGSGFGRASPAPEVGLEVRLRPAGTTPLRVVDSAGNPEAGVDVALRRIVAVPGYLQPVRIEDDISFFARTDSAGTCRVPAHFARGFVEVELSKDGYRLGTSTWKFLIKNEDPEPVFVVGQLARIAGRASTPEGVPVAGQELWLVDARSFGNDHFDNVRRPAASTTTDAKGAYVFENVCEGEWLVGPPYRRIDALRVDAKAAAPIGMRVSIARGATAVAADVRIWRGIYAGGRVIDELGNGVSRVSVLARGSADESPLSSMSYSDGSFLFGPLPGGELDFSFEGDADWAASRLLRVPASTRDMLLRLARAANLRVRVEDASGETWDEVQVTLQTHAESRSANESRWPSRWNDARWHFEGLGAGRYDLVARSWLDQSVAAATVEVASGETRDLVLRLEPAARLELHNRNDAPVRIEYRANSGQVEFVDLPAGAWVKSILPQGSVEVRVLAEQGREVSVRTLTLTAGTTTVFEHP